MEAKLVMILALVAVANSAPQPGFSYEVADAISGDYKSQSESKVGDIVHGHYTLQEPDGSKRQVNYIADEDGFNAVVHKCPAAWARLADAAPVAVAASAPAAPAIVSAAVSAPALRAPAIVPGVVDARLYPALYSAAPSVVSSWPYASQLK